jgi:hypothetical protein
MCQGKHRFYCDQAGSTKSADCVLSITVKPTRGYSAKGALDPIESLAQDIAELGYLAIVGRQRRLFHACAPIPESLPATLQPWLGQLANLPLGFCRKVGQNPITGFALAYT